MTRGAPRFEYRTNDAGNKGHDLVAPSICEGLRDAVVQPPYLANDQSYFRKIFKLTLDRANAGIYFACDLARIEGLMRAAKKQGQDGSPRSAE